MNAIGRNGGGTLRKAATAILAVTVGCSKATPSATETRETATTLASAIAAPDKSVAPSAAPTAHEQPPPMPTVTLLEAGSLPRRNLRYAWRVAQREQLAMDLRTSASTESPTRSERAPIPLPPVHIVIAIDPRSVSAEGDLHYAWFVASATVLADPRTPSPVIAGMRAEVRAVEHLAGNAIVTSRGLTREVAIDLDTMVDAGATGQMVEQIRQTLRDVAAPLPEEDIGRGALWQKRSQLDARETPVTQNEIFALGELREEGGALTDVLTQSAPPQTLHAPGMGPAAQAHMESMLASGNATVRFELSRLVPQTTFDGTTTMVVSGRSSNDAAHRLTMVLHVNIVIEGTKR